MTTFAEKVGAFVVGAQRSDLPEADARAIERSIFDTVGTMLAGVVSSPGAISTRLASSDPDGSCTVIGTGLRRAPVTAALANGLAAHADDFDDMGGYGHPSAPILGGLLAAVEIAKAEGTTVSGEELVTAYATGFELGVALCQTGNYDQYERCFHSTPVFGALAAACAASRALGLDAAQTANAVSIAAAASAGIGRSSGSMVKPLHAGYASRSGLLAALAARRGATAAPETFEGTGGFVHAIFGHRALPLDLIAESLGSPWRAASTIYIKRFPCCGSNHSALNGVERLIAEHDLTAADVEELVVQGMMETSPVLRFPVPATGTNAKFSIQYVLATMLTKRAVRLEDFRDGAITDEGVLAVATRVRPAVVNRWDVQGAAKHKGNAVSVRTTGGETLTASVLRTEIVGSPKVPIPEDALTAKFLDNASLSIGADRGEAAAGHWRSVGTADDVAALIGLVA